MIDLATIPLIQANRCHISPPGFIRPITNIVVHVTQSKEYEGAARGVANDFRVTHRDASSHYTVDDREVIACVKLNDEAWAAPPLNATGIHVELCGFVEQGVIGWNDAFSVAQLFRAADLIAALLIQQKLPCVYNDWQSLLHKEKGITGHNEVSRAWHESDHTDPGPTFPWAAFITTIADNVLTARGSLDAPE